MRRAAPFLLATLAVPQATAHARSAGANVSWGVEPIIMSELKPENLLPAFFFMARNVEGGAYVNPNPHYEGGSGAPTPFDPPDHCADELFEHTMEDQRVPTLPYLVQDDWGCERKPEQVRVLVLENEHLRAAITPQWGGKVWSLFNKRDGRQMLFNYPAHQPESTGIRKAKVTGGAEWNWSPGYPGHSVNTEEEVHAAKIPTERGDVVRL